MLDFRVSWSRLLSSASGNFCRFFPELLFEVFALQWLLLTNFLMFVEAMSFLRSASLRWTPLPSLRASPMLTLKRFASSVKLQSDYGPPVPEKPPHFLERKVPFFVVEPSKKPGSFRKYLLSAREEYPMLLGAVLGVCAYSFGTLAIPAAFAELIDYASKGEFPQGTIYKMVGLFSIAAVGNVLRMALMGCAGEKAIARLRNRLYRAMVNQPAAFFDEPENRTGALVQRLSMDCNLVGASLTDGLTTGVKNIVQTVGSIGVMVYYSPTLTLGIMSIIPPIALFAGVYGKHVRVLTQTMQNRLAEKATIAEERLSNIRTVKSFGREANEIEVYQRKVQEVLAISNRLQIFQAFYSSGLQLMGYFALLGIMSLGSMLVANGSISSGLLFSFSLYTIYCGIGFMGVAQLLGDLNKGYGASMRIFQIISESEEITRGAESCKNIIPLQCQWIIRFNDVDFAYPTRPDAPVYKKLTLELRPSHCTCIVGASGSGKSSLASLILKLYAPSSGSISIDEHSLMDISSSWLRENVGIVGQEPVLFGGTIAQNIAYGLDNHQWGDPIDQWTLQSVIDAAKKANAHDFIVSLPEGYETFVGESGRSLSGGQRQRIAIARALIRHPRLLILDEATSALDSESELVVQEAIEKLINATKSREGQRSVLMFAHKLSMIRKADRVVVLEGGGVKSEGTFEEVSRCPTFCQIVGLSAANSNR